MNIEHIKSVIIEKKPSVASNLEIDEDKSTEEIIIKYVRSHRDLSPIEFRLDFYLI